MTEQELICAIHTYTRRELYRQNNPSATDIDFKNYLKKMNVKEDNLCDILHRFPYKELYFDDKKYSAAFSSYEGIGIKEKIILTQHDRFTFPILHNHNFYEILYLYEGEFLQQIDDSLIPMHTGDFCLIPPNVYHSVDVQNYSIIINILVENTTFHDIFLNTLTGDNLLSTFFLGNIYSPNVNDYIIFHTNGDIQIQNRILRMCLEWINKERYYEQMINTELLMLFGYLLRYYEATAEMPKFKKQKNIQDFAFIKYIEDHYKTITLLEIANKFHYSEQQISARIKKLTGQSFSNYLTGYRIGVAKRLLKDTNMKIKDISLEAGYQSQEHFIRTFKSKMGSTPTEYRNIKYSE